MPPMTSVPSVVAFSRSLNQDSSMPGASIRAVVRAAIASLPHAHTRGGHRHHLLEADGERPAAILVTGDKATPSGAPNTQTSGRCVVQHTLTSRLVRRRLRRSLARRLGGQVGGRGCWELDSFVPARARSVSLWLPHWRSASAVAR